MATSGLRWHPHRRSSLITLIAAAVALLVSTSVVTAAVAPRMIKDINPAGGSSDPDGFVKVGSWVIFRATDGVHGTELWRTDGTAAGTKMVKDINPTGDSDVNSLTLLGTKAYFAANDGVHGFELWRSDGTTAGTVMVKDINRTPASAVTPAAGNLSSGPEALMSVGNVLYFYADDGVHGIELWKSNGTTSSTRMLADIHLGAGSSGWCCPRLFGGAVLFQAFDGAGYELWRSNGTSAGTTKVADLGSSSVGDEAVAGTRYFYIADDTLWVTDGTPGGTDELMSFNSTFYMTALGNKVVFGADDGLTGREPWVSDGTTGGTVPLADIYAAAGDSEPRPWGTVNGLVLFQATDVAHGRELWKTNGTPAGTELVEDINPLGDSGDATACREVMGTRMYFAVDDGTHGEEPWVSDGTAPGTKLLKDVNPGSASSGACADTPLGAFFYFTATNVAKGSELWRTNGTTVGTTRVTDLNPASANSDPGSLEAIGGTLYFTGTDGSHGREPWKFTP